MPRLSLARLYRVEYFKCDPPILLRHSRKHVRLPDTGHAVIRLISDSGIRQKCIAGIPSTQPREFNERDRTYMNEELTLAIDELRERPSSKTWFVLS
jgi:hypothetical protein